MGGSHAGLTSGTCMFISLMDFCSGAFISLHRGLSLTGFIGFGRRWWRLLRGCLLFSTNRAVGRNIPVLGGGWCCRFSLTAAMTGKSGHKINSAGDNSKHQQKYEYD
jgi:hypothetical protein